MPNKKQDKKLADLTAQEADKLMETLTKSTEKTIPNDAGYVTVVVGLEMVDCGDLYLISNIDKLDLVEMFRALADKISGNIIQSN